MKTSLFTLIVLFVVISTIISCNSRFIEPESNSEPILVMSSSEKLTNIIAKKVPECLLITADWDNTSIPVGQSRKFGIKSVSGAIYKWTVSGGLTIVGPDNNNVVVIKAIDNGYSSGVLSVTMDVDGKAYKACGNTGIISIEINGTCTPPNPVFQVMDSNWNSKGETCPNYLLELGIVSDEKCSDFVKYEWSIIGASVQNTTPYGRYIFIRTGRANTYLNFKVRGVYESGVTKWISKSGKTVSGICASQAFLGE